MCVLPCLYSLCVSVCVSVCVCVGPRAKYVQMYHNIFTVKKKNKASLRANNLQLNQRAAPPREGLS